MPTKRVTSKVTNSTPDRRAVQQAKRQAEHARQQAEQARYKAEAAAWKQVENSYKGGVPTRTSEPWQAGQGYRFGSATDRYQLTSARDRAYNAYKNNPVARTLVQTECDNVIGDGLNYQPTTDSEAWNREAKDKYYEWVDRASVCGEDMDTGIELQREIWSMSRVAGSIGWILVSRGIESRIQIVPAESISTPNEFASDENVFDGIRFDAWGRPLVYYVKSNAERRAPMWVAINAGDFVYLPHKSNRNQPRGESCFITIFDTLSHLDRYVDGVSLAAWMATVFGIIFRQHNAAKQMSQLLTVPNSQGVEQRAVTLEGGMVKYVGTDEEVAQVQAQQPMQQTPEFIRSMFRMLGQPFDMPLEVIAKDMSTCTFASARIGLLPFYRASRIKAARFASRWSRSTRWWLSRERLRPDGDPKKWKTAFPENYWSHEFMPNEWDYTDPVSEVQSDMLQCDAGFKSPQMVMSERGRDTKLIIQQREEWEKLTKGLPQTHSTMSRDRTPDPAEQPKPAPVGDRFAKEEESGNGNGRE